MNSLTLRKWMCRLLVLILTLSGMCLEEAEADFSYTGMEQEACARHIRRGERPLVDWEICTDEQMGNETPDAYMQRTVRSRKTAESRDVLNLVKGYPCCALASFERRCAEQVRKNTGRSIAVWYAHRQDGKKSSLSISDWENECVFGKEID